jgi:hypothetical protein
MRWKDDVRRPGAWLFESGIGVSLQPHPFLSNHGLLTQACPVGIPTWTGDMEGQCARPFEPEVRSTTRAGRLRRIKVRMGMCREKWPGTVQKGNASCPLAYS